MGNWEIEYAAKHPKAYPSMAQEIQERIEERHLRRLALKKFAKTQLTLDNRCEALARIIDRSAVLVAGKSQPHNRMMEDLKLVLVGDSLLNGKGRSEGTYFAGHAAGAKGFKQELRDDYNQIQHAMAGIYIGHEFLRPVQWMVWYLEDEEQDDRLYDATIPLGRDLDRKNYLTLGSRVREAIGDSTCQLP